MKIVFIGCVKSSSRFLQSIHKYTKAEIIGIVTKTKSDFNSDHKSLAPFAIENNIEWLEYSDNKQLEEWLKRKKIDLIYCFGWSHILSPSVFTLAKYGAVGYHPTLLPANRGRHPIIWSLVLGLKQTGSSFFLLTEEADAGDIVNQKTVDIEKDDDAASLYEKLMKVGEEQVIELTNDFINQSLTPLKQDGSKANTWRKRSRIDGQIDWRMSTNSILSLIKALSKPYMGAHAVYQNEHCVIWKAKEVSGNVAFIENIEPGKVIGSDGNKFIVKTGDSFIKITDHDWNTIPKRGEYL